MALLDSFCKRAGFGIFPRSSFALVDSRPGSPYELIRAQVREN